MAIDVDKFIQALKNTGYNLVPPDQEGRPADYGKSAPILDYKKVSGFDLSNPAEQDKAYRYRINQLITEYGLTDPASLAKYFAKNHWSSPSGGHYPFPTWSDNSSKNYIPDYAKSPIPPDKYDSFGSNYMAPGIQMPDNSSPFYNNENNTAKALYDAYQNQTSMVQPGMMGNPNPLASNISMGSKLTPGITNIPSSRAGMTSGVTNMMANPLGAMGTPNQGMSQGANNPSGFSSYLADLLKRNNIGGIKKM